MATHIGPFMTSKRVRANLDQRLEVFADDGTQIMVVCSTGPAEVGEHKTIRQEWSRYAITSWCRSVLRWLGEGE